jgi:hypothetical protein
VEPIFTFHGEDIDLIADNDIVGAPQVEFLPKPAASASRALAVDRIGETNTPLVEAQVLGHAPDLRGEIEGDHAVNDYANELRRDDELGGANDNGHVDEFGGDNDNGYNTDFGGDTGPESLVNSDPPASSIQQEIISTQPRRSTRSNAGKPSVRFDDLAYPLVKKHITARAGICDNPAKALPAIIKEITGLLKKDAFHGLHFADLSERARKGIIPSGFNLNRKFLPSSEGQGRVEDVYKGRLVGNGNR